MAGEGSSTEAPKRMKEVPKRMKMVRPGLGISLKTNPNDRVGYTESEIELAEQKNLDLTRFSHRQEFERILSETPPSEMPVPQESTAPTATAETKKFELPPELKPKSPPGVALYTQLVRKKQGSTSITGGSLRDDQKR